MATKTITIKEGAYERLQALKRADESFSDVIERLTGEQTGDWRTHVGFLADESPADRERFHDVMAQLHERREATPSLTERAGQAGLSLDTADTDEREREED